MKISRIWEMPNHRTFEIKCIRKLIYRHLSEGDLSIDPFANECKIASITNDLNPEYNTDFNMDALDFLYSFDDNSVDVIFYDPPYSLRQVSECYKNVGVEVTQETTQSSWRRNHLDQIERILKPGGKVLCFGWNSNGVGITRCFDMLEILIVAHGGSHNDTICTVESKKPNLFNC